MIAEWAATVVQSFVLIFVIFRASKLTGGTARSMAAALFLFATSSFLVSDLYWIVYQLLRPGTRMPLAANQVGEAAMFLLFGSMLTLFFPEKSVPCRKEILCTICFTAASIALWIGWSGEWLQDILGGIAFGYFLCTVVCALKQAGCLSPLQWRLLGVLCIVVVLLAGTCFFTTRKVANIADLVAYLLMLVSTAGFCVKTIRTFRKKENTKQMVAWSFGSLAWTISCLYMSAGIWYLLMSYAGTGMLLFVLFGVEREVKGA